MKTGSDKITLICLPYAGGGAQCFAPLQPFLPPGLELLEVTLPGRGRRFHEPVLNKLDDLLADAWLQVKPRIRQPYALFGHSMGALLVYLLCHKIRQAGLPPPLHLFLSGREAPTVPAKEPFEYLLPSRAFKANLENYGGMAMEILQDEEVFAFFEPMIRADFQAVETWQYRPRPKLNLPVTVFSGTEEDMTQEEVRAWQQEFLTKVRFEVFQGDHFFIFEQAETVAGIIASQLQPEGALAMSC